MVGNAVRPFKHMTGNIPVELEARMGIMVNTVQAGLRRTSPKSGVRLHLVLQGDGPEKEPEVGLFGLVPPTRSEAREATPIVDLGDPIEVPSPNGEGFGGRATAWACEGGRCCRAHSPLQQFCVRLCCGWSGLLTSLRCAILGFRDSRGLGV